MGYGNFKLFDCTDDIYFFSHQECPWGKMGKTLKFLINLFLRSIVSPTSRIELELDPFLIPDHVQIQNILSLEAKNQKLTHCFRFFHLPFVQLMRHPFSCLVDLPHST